MSPPPPPHSSSQVQSIKQNNSILKQSLNEGVDTFRPSEVSFLKPFPLLYILPLLPTFTSLLAFTLVHVTPPCSSSLLIQFLPLVGLRLVLICYFLSSHHPPPPPTHPPPLSQPAPKMNSRWTTEEQLLAVQGESRLQHFFHTDAACVGTGEAPC